MVVYRGKITKIVTVNCYVTVYISLREKKDLTLGRKNVDMCLVQRCLLYNQSHILTPAKSGRRLIFHLVLCFCESTDYTVSHKLKQVVTDGYIYS